MTTELVSAEDQDSDADVRYNAKITGYDRRLRGRIRQTQTQVSLLVTKRIRDTATVAHHLEPATLKNGYERVLTVARLIEMGYAGPGDLRAEYASLAATAMICAEECDRPPYLKSVRAPKGALGALAATELAPSKP